MNKNNKNNPGSGGNFDEIDKFWDIASLLPKTAAKTPRAGYGFQIRGAMISGGEEAPSESREAGEPIPPRDTLPDKQKTAEKSAEPSAKISVESDELSREEKRAAARRIICEIEQKSELENSESKIIEANLRLLDKIHEPNPLENPSTKANPPPKTTGQPHIVKKYIPPHKPPAPPSASAEVYSPEFGYIRKVIIYKWPSNYSFYDKFRRDALHYKNAAARPCEREPYFSYIPQYSQLNPAQLAWYIWWRENVRAGKYPETDFSYIMLYIYEIINLSDEIPPEEGRASLCGIWRAYRAAHPSLDKYLAEWVCDYSLIHRLPPPTAELLGGEDGYFAMTRGAVLREYYLGSGGSGAMMRARSLIEYSSGYDWRKSKYATAENRELYERHIYGALTYALEKSAENGKNNVNNTNADNTANPRTTIKPDENQRILTSLLRGDGLQLTRLTRDAYNGSLCSHNTKKRIEVEYLSLSRTHELRFLVTDIIKYSENKIRAYIGVKSRLGLFALSSGVRALLDEYFAGTLPAKPRGSVKIPPPPPEYEKMYDLPETALSPERAAEIERASWDTTYKLITAFGESPDSPPESPPNAPPETPQNDKTEIPPDISVETPPDLPSVATPETAFSEEFPSLLYKKLSERGLLEFIEIIERGTDPSAEQRRFADARGELLDCVADGINDLAAELAGDVILYEDEKNTYKLYETYREALYGE